MAPEHLDVLIVGAGLSGIGAAHHVRRRRPGATVALLEARAELGGTWSLFRYPGVRSDSDMHTLGYAFRPWPEAKAIADGPAILAYLRDTARETGVEALIRYNKQVVAASWSTPDARWTLDVQDTRTGETTQLTCGFLLGCTGYFRYDQGHVVAFPGRERFPGPVVHPQDWPADLDVAGLRVVVVGSGATAVTLVPALAEQKAAHVTMLQRSPTYITSLPSVDPIAEWLRARLPARPAFAAVRWKNILTQIAIYQLSQRRPGLVKRLLRRALERQLPGFDIDRHLTPRYDPWDQRLCLVPDGDLFRVLRKGRADIVTDHVERFDAKGIVLRGGGHLDADVIVTATGLELLLFGAIAMTVDGVPVDLPRTMVYKGLMLEGVPNLAFALGYTNASWTLKADLMGQYVGRLLKLMEQRGARVCVARNDDPSVEPRPLLDFDAGYVLRHRDELPQSGSKGPWRLRMNPLVDTVALRRGRLDDGVLQLR